MNEQPGETPPVDESGHPSAHTTLARQGVFLEAFARLGNVTGACRETETTRASHYQWLADADYRARFAVAQEMAADALVQEARRRALEGVSKGYYQQGRLMETVTEYSDQLLMFLMKGAMPSIYRDNAKPDEAAGAASPPGWEQQQVALDLLDEVIAERVGS